jgi:hypothetical protein
MSDNRWLSLPRGWRVEQPDDDPNYQGTVGVLRRADEASLRAARKNLREIDEKEIEGQGLRLLERPSGETWQVVTTHVDLLNPASSGVQAFVVRDGLFVPLRPPEWKNEKDTSQVLGESYGRPATAKDPLPVLPSGLEIR